MQKIRLYFSTLLLLIVAVSCAKEESLIKAISEDEITDNGNSIGEPLTITAYIDNGDTKTSYDEETTFSWTENDLIAVQLYGIKEGDSNYHKYNQYKFKANSSSASSTFTTATDLNTTIWAINDYAFYPKENAYGTNTELLYEPAKGPQTVWLYQVITPDATKPMGAIPLIGRKQSAGDVTTNAEFSFKTAVGILKLTVTNIPASARKIKITSSGGEKLSGYFTFDEDCEIKMANKSDSYSSYDYKTILFTPEYEGETRSFYFPIPTGTFESGFTVDLLDDSDGVLKTISTSKSVTIKRNELMILPSFSGGSEWSYLGQAKFVDNFLFSMLLNGDNESMVKTGVMIDVPIWKSTTVAGKFKMTSPYQAAADQFESKTLTTQTVDDEFVFYTSYAGLTEGQVYFESNVTNLCFNDNTHQAKICSPQDKGSSVTENNKVLYSSGGEPTVIQLAPRYEDASNSGYCYTKYSSSGMIYIVFPGENVGKTVIGTYYVGGTPSSSFSYKIEESDDLSKGNIKLTKYSNASASITYDGVAYGTYNPETATLSIATKRLFTIGTIDATTVYYSIYADDGSYLLNNGVFTFSGTYNDGGTGKSYIKCGRTGTFGIMYYTDEANLGTWTGYNLTSQKFSNPTLVRY